jgi:putative MATE family efflux protein
MNNIKKFFLDSVFWSDVVRLALPISLQNLLTNSLGMVDTLMVSQLGDVALSGVGIGGQFSWLMGLFLFGLGSGSAVFISQYWGIKDIKQIKSTYGILLLNSLFVSLLFMSVGLIQPAFIVRLMNNEPAVLDVGVKYLKIAVFSYIPIGLNSVFGTLLRSTEEVKLPILTSSITAVTNVILNYALIFGKFGLPEMGIEGAALATAITSWLSPLILLLFAVCTKNIMYVKITELFRFGWANLKRFYKISLPVILNESLWGVGTFGYSMVFGQMAYENLAAIMIYKTVEGVAFIFFVGLCNACCVLVGKAIGAGYINEGFKTGVKFTVLMVSFSVIVGTGLILLRDPIINMFNYTGNMSEFTKTAVKAILLVYGIEVIIRNIPYVLIVGVFRAGGDTKTGMKYDIMCLWFFSLPMTWLAAFVFRLPFVAVFILMLLCEDVPKVTMCIYHFVKKKWVKPLTEQGNRSVLNG